MEKLKGTIGFIAGMQIWLWIAVVYIIYKINKEETK